MTELMIDFSQSGEQKVILDAVEELGLEHGTFLDIGAGDGRTFSNTVALAARGWNGVCVEPAPWAVDSLSELYRPRENIRVCQAVVTSTQSGLVRFEYARGDHVSTIDAGEARKWASKVEYESIDVCAITIEQLIAYYQPFARSYEFISVDAEGLTNELVRALTRTFIWEDVKLICFEREDFASKGALALAPPMELVVSTPNNHIYRRAS